MENERLRVLKMLEEGLITAEEAAKLLDALQSGSTRGRAAPSGRVLRIRVTDAATGRVQGTVNVPLGLAQVLARAGMGLGALWAPQTESFDLPALLRAVEAGEPGQVVEWSEGESGRRFEVSIE